MAYLFWAFALVWLGLFAYLYGLVRRSRALERRIAELSTQARAAAEAGSRASRANVADGTGHAAAAGAAAPSGMVAAGASRRSAGE